MERSAQIIATCLALGAYAIAMIAGLAAQNPVLLVMRRGLIVLVFAYAVGLAIGMILEHIVREQVARYRQANAAPDLEAIERASQGEVIEAA